MLGKLAFTNKIVAKHLGQDEARVTKVMDFFVRELNAELMRVDHAFVYVRGLGTFGLSLKPIETRIRHMWTAYRKALRGETAVRQSGIRNTEKSCLALRQTLFELFAIRRLLKTKRRELKTLRDDRKVRRNIQGELLPDQGMESGPIQ